MVLGTPIYMAPELISETQVKYDYKVDVWSLGIITYQILSGETPYDGEDIDELERNILKKKLKFKAPKFKTISKEAKDFIS